MWELVYGYERLKDLKRIKAVLKRAIIRNRCDGYAIQIRRTDRAIVLEFLGVPIREAEDTREGG